MNAHLLLTVISDDKPGIVRRIADTVTRHQGNWLESRMAQLAGKFVGVIHVSTRSEQSQALQESLNSLQQEFIYVTIEPLSNAREPGPRGRNATFTAIGPDRPGIVLEISQAFAEYNINVVQMDTECSSMPYSGEPLFEIRGSLSLPPETDLDLLLSQLDIIADQLGVDVDCEEINIAG